MLLLKPNSDLLKRLGDGVNLELYIHHPGQLVRRLDKYAIRTYIYSFENYNNYITITPSLISVLTKRADSKVPCNHALDDGEDDEDDAKQKLC